MLIYQIINKIQIKFIYSLKFYNFPWLIKMCKACGPHAEKHGDYWLQKKKKKKKNIK